MWLPASAVKKIQVRKSGDRKIQEVEEVIDFEDVN
jgi:hypothetical protein